MRHHELAERLLRGPEPPEDAVIAALRRLGFEDPLLAAKRLRAVCAAGSNRDLFLAALPALLHALSEAATPDGSLMNFQRFAQCVPDRGQLFRELAAQPRRIEILVKLFVGSQFLTEILLRNPHYLERLTAHKRLAEFKSRPEFEEEGRRALAGASQFPAVLLELRRLQQWELLRLAACDTFGLMDLKTVTLQLALLADSLVTVALEWLARDSGLSIDQFAVLAFGKLGGEELNYSSDIDLVFVCGSDPERYRLLGQRLIKVLGDATELGFLYRVDMRLRPWGAAGPLVATAEGYRDYLRRQAQAWEKQALLKARAIAGDREFGEQVLVSLMPSVFDVSAEVARRSIRDMKEKVEQDLQRRGKLWGEVKRGPGGIRDIEFITQFLQLAHGAVHPEVRSINTLDALIRLAERSLIFPEEYRRLTGGYLILRAIEHALQLMHNKQEHQLPASERELAYLARRLDLPDAATLVRQFTLHTTAVREIFESYLGENPHPLLSAPSLSGVDRHLGAAAASYRDAFSADASARHLALLNELDPQTPVRLEVRSTAAGRSEVTIIGIDQRGDLSAICGLLFASGFDIMSGEVITGAEVDAAASQPEVKAPRRGPPVRQRRFVNVFDVRVADPSRAPASDVWTRFEAELTKLLRLAQEHGLSEMQGQLARRVAAAIDVQQASSRPGTSLDIEVADAPTEAATVLTIRGEDTPGFLYELTNAITTWGLSIQRMTIRSDGARIRDILHVVDEHNRSLPFEEGRRELCAAIALIQQFTHVLPLSPNPESALVHFQGFLENLFQQPNWLEQFSALQDADVLAALARLLGISDFLWEDFLRQQHQNLFPVVSNLKDLQQPRDRQELSHELKQLLAVTPGAERRNALNAFKDRQMMRVDMRHILGLQDKFGMFSRELTAVAEAVVANALRLCRDELVELHGTPRTSQGAPARLCLCALGKFGGRELGYASDIELMFLYDGDGQTSGSTPISNLEFYDRLVSAFRKTIRTRRKGIFEIDLRLRPYGKAGSQVVSLAAFEKYFSPEGPAWPYERQALVKLRPVAGNLALGREIVMLRDQLIYRGETYDVAAMRAMRERQIRQLVQGGSFHAKLSPGGLADCEYLVQGLQMTFGHLAPSIREPNTREAMKALEAYGILTGESRLRLRDAYRFFRRVIDALRVVRGDASELSIPPIASDEFFSLGRRLGYGLQPENLQQDLERHTRNVVQISATLEQLVQRRARARPRVRRSADRHQES